MQVAMDTKVTAATMFALSAASASLLWRVRSSKECRAATQFPKTLALFKTAFLHSTQESMKYIMFEEECLKRIVKDIRDHDTFVVLVDFPPSCSDHEVCQYVSIMYLMLYDLCVEVGKASVSCYVLPSSDEAAGSVCSVTKFKSAADVVAAWKSSTPVDEQNMQLYTYKGGAMEAAVQAVAHGERPVTLFDRALAVDRFTDDMVYFDTEAASGSEKGQARGVQMPKYNKVACGGTFDRIHCGHKILLTLALYICTGELTVGITSEQLLKGKANAKAISSADTRRRNVEQFMQVALAATPQSPKVVTPTLVDAFGPTISDPDMQAIIVSSETIGGALKANAIRAERGFRPLVVYVVRRSSAATLSSTFLRKLES